MANVIRFKTALYLSLVIALFQLVGFIAWWPIVGQRPNISATEVITICIVPFVVCFGLWVQSVFLSAISILWMLIRSAALVWPLLSSHSSSAPLARLFAIMAALNLATAGILLTKRSRAEFADERRRQPKYKMYLRWALFIAVIGVMGLATAEDVVRLVSE